MAEIHHAQGLTEGCLAFADELFTDAGLRDHDAEAAALLRTRVLGFFEGLA